MAKKLYYFDINGIAEAIRYLLHYAGETFEDIRYEGAKWPIQGVIDKLPYGQLPKYEEGDKSLNQSVAIARYIASKTNLLPSDPWEQAVLDSAVLNAYELWGKVILHVREQDPVKKKILKEQFLEEHLPYYLSRYEKELNAGNGHFGEKLSWADFVLVGIVESVNLFLGQSIEKEYPAIAALINEVTSQRGVNDYINTRKPYVFNY